jgi:NTP pyrophosphatase (non-canonical NTP hydrolase)
MTMTVLEMRRRFPWPKSFHDTGSNPDFVALALCGEVAELGELLLPLTISTGKLANLMKKGWRGDGYNTDAIRSEIADIRIYLELIAQHFGCDGEAMLPVVWDKMVAKAKELGVGYD